MCAKIPLPEDAFFGYVDGADSSNSRFPLGLLESETNDEELDGLGVPS